VKIERISENQIRCTLSKHDLSERHLKISELAYGSEKAKELFRDMMEQASIDFGFDADDIPLMIEAIPTSRDSIVLVITKVDNPDEFEERFSHFGIGQEDFEDDDSYDLEEEESDEDMPEIVDCFEQLHELIEEANEKNSSDGSREFIPLSEALKNSSTKKKAGKKKKSETISDKVKVFSFVSLNPIIEVAHLVSPGYSGKNSVWKDETASRYYLMLNRSGRKAAFQTACSLISEFGKEELVTYATQDFYNEHFKLIIKDKALERLAQL